MDLLRARSALDGSRFSRIDGVFETGSTNTDLLEAARRGEGERVLTAEHQTAGRGRLGRPWQARAGASVMVSFLVRPAPTLPTPHLLTSAIGLAAADAVEAVCGLRVGIKWPNDLVVGTADRPDDRKLAGVLAEAVAGAGGIEAVVVGIGLNANWGSMPPELGDVAAALDLLTGAEVDRTALLIEMVRRAGELIDDFERDPDGPARLQEAIANRSATLGRRVRVELPDGELIGEAVGLTPEGALEVDLGDDVRVVSVGDVVHLRPTG